MLLSEKWLFLICLMPIYSIFCYHEAGGVATAISAVSMIRGPRATGGPQSGRRAPQQILIQGPFRTSYDTAMRANFRISSVGKYTARRRFCTAPKKLYKKKCGFNSKQKLLCSSSISLENRKMLLKTYVWHVRGWNLDNWRSGEKKIGSFRNVVLQKNEEYQSNGWIEL